MKGLALANWRTAPRWFAPAFAAILIALSSIVAQGKVSTVANLTQLNAALKEARPGDLLLMANGDWRDTVINFSAQATAERPVTLRAQTPGKVFLTGRSKLSLSSPFLVVDGLFFKDGSSEDGSPVIAFKSNHCRVTNTAIVNFNPSSRRANSWVLFDGDRNRLDHCFFQGKNNRGPLVANTCCQSRHHRVDSCYFKDILFVSENGREVIQVQGNGRSDQYDKDGAFFIIENNLFERADGEGAEIISIKSNFNTIRYNTVRATRGGFTLRSGYANTVEGNFIFGEGVKGAGGIRVQGHNQRVVNNYIEGVESGLALHSGEHLLAKDCTRDYLTQNFIPLKRDEAPCGYVVHYGQVRDSLFAHNTFVNNTGVDIEIGIGYKSRWPEQQMVRLPENNTFANNLIYKPDGGIAISTQVQDSNPPLDRLTFRPNQFQGNLVTGGATKINSPSSGEQGVIFVSLKLVPAGGLFRPASGSPAINAAVGDYVKDDVDGQPRNKADIGADEVSSSSVKRRPLTPRDVGPVWMR
jgi:poly(beta-D-mannuronate) lyase